MKIRFLHSVGGPDYQIQAGAVVEIASVPHGDGPRFLNAGIAVPAEEEQRTAEQPRKTVRKAVTKE